MGSLLSWLSNCLSDRNQSVIIQREELSFRNIHVGIPQGTTLGPLPLYTVRHCVKHYLTHIYICLLLTILS